MPLTNPACINATCPDGKPCASPYPDSQGLYLEVLPNGGKYWRLEEPIRGGKEKRLALACLPPCRWRRLARAGPARAINWWTEGSHPSRWRTGSQACAAPGHRATQFKKQWRAPGSRTGAAHAASRHASYVLRRLEADVFPVIGHKPIGDVLHMQLLAMAKKIESRGHWTLPSAPCKPAGKSSATQWPTGWSSATRPQT